MKSKIIPIICSLFFFWTGINEITAQTNHTICKDFYQRLLVSKNMVKFTNQYIDSKAKERMNVPAYLWETVKQSINYSIYENTATDIICNRYSTHDLQKILSENTDREYIKLASLPLHEELYNAIKDFQFKVVDKRIDLVLIQAGY